MTLLLAATASYATGAEATPRWEEAIDAFEAADQENRPPEGGILFIGSSSIRGWRSLPEDFPQYEIINRGFGGSHIADSIAYVDRIVIPYRPSLIVFYAGENDLAAGKPPQQVADDFREFVTRVRDELPGAKIAFISMKPSPSRWHLADAKREGNRLIRDYASTEPGIDYINVWEAMLNENGEPREELFIGDDLHLNAKGYAVWKEIIVPHLAHHAAAQNEGRARCCP